MLVELRHMTFHAFILSFIQYDFNLSFPDKHKYENRYGNEREDNMRGNSLIPPEAKNPMYEFALYPIDIIGKVNTE